MFFTIHLEDSMTYWKCYLEMSLKYTNILFLSCDRLHPVRPRCRTVQLKLWSRVNDSFNCVSQSTVRVENSLQKMAKSPQYGLVLRSMDEGNSISKCSTRTHVTTYNSSYKNCHSSLKRSYKKCSQWLCRTGFTRRSIQRFGDLVRYP